MKKLAVIGKPVAHSKSPDIFKYLFKKNKIDAVYTRISVNKSRDIIPLAEKYNICAFNVTSPFKKDIIKHLDKLDPVSEITGSVNSVIRKNNVFYGFNTDVYGVKACLSSNSVDPSGKKCTVIGAGGAAVSAVHALNELGANVFISNRTDKKAEDIAAKFKCKSIMFKDLDHTLKDSFLVIPAVSGTMNFSKNILKSSIILDPNYHSESLCIKCKKYIKGYEWLFYQAVKFFELFEGTGQNGCYRNELRFLKKRKMNPVFIGMTGVGKTELARMVAEHFGYCFYDSDEEVEKAEGMKTAKIFKHFGEQKFRKLEENMIESFCTKDNILIAAGAGSVLSEKVRKVLKENCFIVLIDTDIDIIASRMKKIDISKRPLIRPRNITQSLKDMFFQRKDIYYAVSDLIINSSSSSVTENAERIIEELNAR
ncbi:MAG: shikimate kinase [Candidatus Delongbacteria bacterium]